MEKIESVDSSWHVVNMSMNGESWRYSPSKKKEFVGHTNRLCIFLAVFYRFDQNLISILFFFSSLFLKNCVKCIFNNENYTHSLRASVSHSSQLEIYVSEKIVELFECVNLLFKMVNVN